MQNVIQMALKWLSFLEKSKSRPATGVSPPDPHLCEMIELLHFAQLAIQSRHFSKKILTSKPSLLAKILAARLFMGVGEE